MKWNEVLIHITYNADKPRKHCYVKELGHKSPHVTGFHLYEMPGVGDSEVESRLLFA